MDVLENFRIETNSKTFLNKAAIIDDAFDAVLENEIEIDRLKVFYQKLDVDIELTTLLADFGITLPDIDDLESDDVLYLDHLNILWNLRQKNENLDNILRELFPDKFDKLFQLELICKNISGCNVVIEKFGSNITDIDSNFANGEFDFIFIDYYLGVTGDPRAKVNAQELASAIYEKCPKDKKPITVLMSSKPNVENLKSDFRRDTPILGVGFIFYSKQLLQRNENISLTIEALKFQLNHYHKIQQYIISLYDAADSALKLFQKEIRDLSIDDYAFIQFAKLNEDKHPLGDYMTWLYGSRLGNLLYSHTELSANQKEIDMMAIPGPIMLHDMPSDNIAKLYSSALFEEHLEDIAPHPRKIQGSGNLFNEYYLHLGDILANNNTELVWMVANPQCDLERDVPAERSIILIPGTLANINEIGLMPNTYARTDFFLLNDIPHTIFWKIKEVITILNKDFHSWKISKNVVRNHRLKLSFALEIQQIFTSLISRIGTPISPPIKQIVDVEIYVRKPNKEVVNVRTIKRLAFVSNVRTGNEEKTKISFTLNFIYQMKVELINLVSERESFSLDGLKASKQNEFKEKTNKLKTFTDSFDTWFTKKYPFELPNKGKILDTDSISWTIDSDPQKIQFSTFILANVKFSDIEIPPKNENEEKPQQPTFEGIATGVVETT